MAFKTPEEAIEDLLNREPIRLSAWDAVNQPMVRQWADVLGNKNPKYWNGEAVPRSMLYSWTMKGYGGQNPEGPTEDFLKQASNELTPFGYIGKMATIVEHKYFRAPRWGEMLCRVPRIESISPLKKTKVGEGYFVTEMSETFSGDESIGEIRTTLYVFKPVDDDRPEVPQQLPSKTEKLFFTIPITPDFIVSSAIATRDYEDVHLNPSIARAGGAADIYLNILTTMGLFQRCAEEGISPDLNITGLTTSILSAGCPGDTLHLVETGRKEGELSIAALLDEGVFASGTVFFDE